MPALRIDIDTNAAQRAAEQLRAELANLGSSAVNTTQQFARLTQQLNSIQGAGRTDNALTPLLNSLDAVRSNALRSQSAINDLGGAIRQTSNIANNAGSVFSQMFASFTLANIATQAIYKVGSSIEKVFKDAFNSVEAVKLSTAALASTITTFADKSGGKSLSEIYKQAYGYSVLLNEKMEEWNAKTVATGANLKAMVETLVQGGVLLDINNKKQESGIIAIANAIAITTAGQNADIQFRQEIRGLIDGEARAVNRLASMLDSTLGGALKENVKKWKEQGTLIENIGALLSGFTAGTKDLEATWQAVGTTLDTIYQRSLRGMFVPVYEEIIKLGQEITVGMMEQNQYSSETGETLKTTIYKAWIDIKNAVSTVSNLIMTFEVPLKVVGWLLGSILDGWGQILAIVEVIVAKVRALAGAMRDTASAIGTYMKGLGSGFSEFFSFDYEGASKGLDKMAEAKKNLDTSLNKKNEELSKGLMSEIEKNLAEYNRKLTVTQPKQVDPPKMQKIADFDEQQKAAKKAAREAESAAKKAANEAKRQAEEMARIREKADDDYRKSILAGSDYQKEKIEATFQEYKKAGYDLVNLEKWKQNQIRDIEEKRIDDFDKGFDKERDAAKKLTEDLKDEAEKRAKDAQEALEKQAEAYNDFVNYVTAQTSDVILGLFDGGFSSFFDELQGMFKRVLADMAAEAIAKPIVVPVVQAMVGTFGQSVANSFGIPEGAQGAVSGGGGILDMASSANSLYNAVSGGLEGGVYKALTSGILNTAGSSLFGATAWGGVAGAELGWGATAAATTGMGTAGIAGAIAAVAPWAALAAVAVPLVMKAFEDEPEPFLRVQTGTKSEMESRGYKFDVGEGQSNAGYRYNLTMQDTDSPARKAMGDAVTKMMDAQFKGIEDTLDVSINEAITKAQDRAGEYGKGFFSKIDLRDYEGDIEGALKALSEDLFKDIRGDLASQLKDSAGAGLSEGIFNDDFFSGIAATGEAAVDTFFRFGQTVQNTDNFMAEFTRQTTEFGMSAIQAYNNVSTISAIMEQLEKSASGFTDNDAFSALEDINTAYDGLIETLKAMNATVETLNSTEQFRFQELGAAVTGLTSTSVASALWTSIQQNQSAGQFVQTLEDNVRSGVTQAVVNGVSDSIYQAFIAPINSAVGTMVSSIVSGGMTTGAAIQLGVAKMKEALDAAILLMRDETFKTAIADFIGVVQTNFGTSTNVGETTYYDYGTGTGDSLAQKAKDEADKKAEDARKKAEQEQQVAQSSYQSEMDTTAKAIEEAAQKAKELADMMKDVSDAIYDSKLSDYGKQLADISREYEKSTTAATELGASQQQLNTIYQESLIEIQKVVDAFEKSSISLAKIQGGALGLADSVIADMSFYYDLGKMFNTSFEDILKYSKQDILDIFLSQNAYEWGALLEQAGVNLDDFTGLMSYLVDSIAEDTNRIQSIRIAQASISGTTDAYNEQFRRDRLNNLFGFDFSDFSDSEMVDTFKNLTGTQIESIVSQLGDGVSEFIQIMTDMNDAIKNADGIKKFQIAMEDVMADITTAAGVFQKTSSGVNFNRMWGGLVDAIDFFNLPKEELQFEADFLINAFKSVSDAAKQLAIAGTNAATTLYNNLHNLFTSDDESGYFSQSKTDQLIDALRKKIEVALDANQKIIDSSVMPATQAYLDMSRDLQAARNALQDNQNAPQINTIEADILNQTIASLSASIQNLLNSLTPAGAAVKQVANIVNTIGTSVDTLEQNIINQGAKAFNENATIRGMFPAIDSQTFSALSDIAADNADSYTTAFSKLIDLFTGNKITQDMFNQAFDLATQIFTGDIVLNDKDTKLKDIKDSLKSVFESIFDTVSSVVISATEKAQYDIANQAIEFSDLIVEQKEAFSKITPNDTKEYKEIADILNIAPDVILKWSQVELAILQLDEMRKIGSSRGSFAGTSTAWDILALESDFQDINQIATQATVYNRYMTSSWSDLSTWMQDIGYSSDDFATAMQTVKESLDRVTAITDAKAGILGVSDKYQLAKNEQAWGLASGSLSSRDYQQQIVDWFLNTSSEGLVEWTDSMGLNTDDFITNIQSMSDNLKSTNEAFENITDTLEDYQKKLINSDSMLNPDVIYRQKLTAWNSNLLDMKSSDPEIIKTAMDKFTGLSDDLLDSAKKSMTDQYAYAQLWGKIYAATEQARNTTEEQITQSKDEAKEIQANWTDLIKTNDDSQKILTKQREIQIQLAEQVKGLSSQVLTLAKSEDFNSFFTKFNVLFAPESAWVTSLRTAIESVAIAIQSIKINTPTPTVAPPSSNVVPVSQTPITTPITTPVVQTPDVLNPATTTLTKDETIAKIMEQVRVTYAGNNEYSADFGVAKVRGPIGYMQMFAEANYQGIASMWGIPGYAAGGYHEGGLRLVGELGPELEYTGKSRIFSNSDTKSLLNNDALIKEMKELNEEMRQLKEYGYQNLKVNTKAQKTLDKWDYDGQPAERVTA